MYSVCMRTQTDQKLSGHLFKFMQTFNNNFFIGMKQNQKYEYVRRNMFLHMDETAI